MIPAELRAKFGQNFTLFWEAPKAIEPGEVPTLAVRLKLATINPVLAPLFAPVAVSAMNKDRQELTVALSAAGYRGAQGEYGAAFYVTEGGGWFPVRVGSVEDNVVKLVDPIPRFIPAVGSLQWATWYTVITAAQLPNAERSIPWTVTYQAQGGLSLPAFLETYEGLLHASRQPFNTGLTSGGFLGIYTQFSNKTPRRAQGWGEYIAAAFTGLVEDVRAIVRGAGVTEDEVHGPTLRNAHATLTAAMFYEAQTKDGSEERAAELRALYATRLDTALEAVWVDLNKDGNVDGDEGSTHITGGRNDVGGGNFPTIVGGYQSPFGSNRHHTT